MPAKLVVFANDRERGMCCADYGHDFDKQPRIFGNEQEKFLELAYELFHASLRYDRKNEAALKKKLFGIAKSHGLHIDWWGDGNPCEPDRFLISGHGEKRLAFIQC